MFILLLFRALKSEVVFPPLQTPTSLSRPRLPNVGVFGLDLRLPGCLRKEPTPPPPRASVAPEHGRKGCRLGIVLGDLRQVLEAGIPHKPAWLR